MSYNLSVHIKGLSDNILHEWLSEIRKFNMDVQVHPEFSFSNHSGFLPFKIVNYDCPNKKLNNIELMTGFELYVNQIEGKTNKKSFISKLFEKKQHLSSIERKLQEADTEVSFIISIQDSFEFRIGWYSATSLALICDGVLTDHYEGIQLEGQELIRHAQRIVIEDERQIKEDEWKIHEFKNW